jgi:GTP-binding protein HflX
MDCMIPTLVFYLYEAKRNQNNVLKRTPEQFLEESVTLCQAIDLNVCHQEIVKLRSINAGQIFSNDRLDAIKDIITLHNAELIVIDWHVSPIQQRNLEKYLNVKILDRIGLIIEIFGRRAATKEGKLQVELAQMNYQKGRLVKAWSHLERQRGGGGFTGGPGETQQENDRRMIDEKIIKIENALKEVVKTRKLHRSARQKVPYPIISLAGYTNAGKSTLFNQLTQSTVLEADMLFATLDPTLRTLKLPSGDKIILSDTVGFISNLPTQLVKAFRATLEEILSADIILHVRDIANEETFIQCQDVNKVLNTLDDDLNIPIIEILNKVDLINSEKLTLIINDNNQREQEYVSCSAKTKVGIDDILIKIDTMLAQSKQTYQTHIDIHHADVIAGCLLYTSDAADEEL